MRKPTESCGVAGAASSIGEDVLPYVYRMLIVLNHRGQQSYGILAYDGGVFRGLKRAGLVSETDLEELVGTRGLSGSLALGHVRYATSGGDSPDELLLGAQPVLVERNGLRLALAYNGNLVNARELAEKQRSRGSETGLFADADVLAREILDGIIETGDVVEALALLAERVDGAYSVVCALSDGSLLAFRDPRGLKPLAVGSIDERRMFLASSESAALEDLEVSSWTHVGPGELVSFDGEETSRLRFAPGEERLCAFEFAYFARPDSRLLPGCRYVYEIRRELGAILAERFREVMNRIDIIAPVPETAVDAALGLASASGKPIEPVIVRHRYVKQRAFILDEATRRRILEMKYNVLRDKVAGARIALIDDSIVRGETTRLLVERLKRAGAREVHVFSTFPKISHPCFYGIDMATYEELAGFERGPEEVARLIGADSVCYQEPEDYVRAVGSNSLCMACVTGIYPTPRAQRLADEAREEASRRIELTSSRTRRVRILESHGA